MQSRRIFIGKVASGLAGAIAAPNVLASSDRIRLGAFQKGSISTQERNPAPGRWRGTGRHREELELWHPVL